MTTTIKIDAAIEYCDRLDAAVAKSSDPEEALRLARSAHRDLVAACTAQEQSHKRLWQERNEALPLPVGAADAGDWDNGNGVGADPGPQEQDYREVFYAHIVIDDCVMANLKRIQHSDGTLEPLEIWTEEVWENTPDEARQFARELLAAIERAEAL